MTLLPHSTIVGAGPVGCLLAIFLRQRGVPVTLFEARPDLRDTDLAGGRSINLVLTRRGLAALDAVGLKEKTLTLTVPVLGRMMHDRHGTLAYQPYGRDESECNYSISRTALNQCLLDAAEAAGATIHFQSPLENVDFSTRELLLQNGSTHRYSLLFAADGAPSVVRRSMAASNFCTPHVDMMDWGYKELTFPAGPDNSYRMAGHALHIWPRGHHFLMGLANLDGSFTGTLYLPIDGPESFASLTTERQVLEYFQQFYPDAIDLLGDYVSELLDHPTGVLGTVRTDRWSVEDQALLIGDAAHGIVPFFGQGLNSGFEDCAVLDRLIDKSANLERLFHGFVAARKPNTDAIATMALENFVEMSEKVGDPAFLLRKKVEARLEAELPQLYRSRYALVMYSHLSYSDALKIGEAQKILLDRLTQGATDPSQIDMIQARDMIRHHLTPLYDQLHVELPSTT